MMEKPLDSRQEIFANLDAIEEGIRRAAAAAGRSREEIHLMAVTKTVEPERVNCAIEYGVKLLGENRGQELVSKYEAYNRDGVEIHFIGTLQTNKVRQIIDKVSMVESVNSLRLAEEINRLAGSRLGRPMDILIEVNIGEEESKSGIAYPQAEELVRQAAAMPWLHVRGLMCIPPICETEEQLEGYFEKMHRLFVDIAAKNIDNVNMDFLSMGMSGDYEAAIRHGANIVRIGSSMFGKRIYKEK